MKERPYMEDFGESHRRISKEELSQTAQRFSTGVDGIFDKFPYHIEETSTPEGEREQTLFIEGADGYADFSLSRIYSELDHKFTMQSLTARFFNATSRADYEHAYRFLSLPSDIVYRRTERLNLSEGESGEDHLENEELGVQMGINDQPVRLTEVESLLKEVADSEPFPTTFDALSWNHYQKAVIPFTSDEGENSSDVTNMFGRYVQAFLQFHEDQVISTVTPDNSLEDRITWEEEESEEDTSNTLAKSYKISVVQRTSETKGKSSSIDIMSSTSDTVSAIHYEVVDDLLISKFTEPSLEEEKLVPDLARVNNVGLMTLFRFINTHKL